MYVVLVKYITNTYTVHFFLATDVNSIYVQRIYTVAITYLLRSSFFLHLFVLRVELLPIIQCHHW